MTKPRQNSSIWSCVRRRRNGKCRRANGARRKPSSPSCSKPGSSWHDGQPAPHTRFLIVPPAPLHLHQELTPAVSALPDADLEADQLLPALGRRADHHQHALGMLLHASLQVDAISPEVHVAPCREIPPLPVLVLSLPFPAQPSDH